MMSHQQQYPPPPPPQPPPTPGFGAFFQHQRRRPTIEQSPPALATSFTGLVQAPGQGAGSAISYSAPGTPFPFPPPTPVVPHPRTPSGLNPASQSAGQGPSVSPMEPYNPRQWNPRGQVSGSQMVFGRAVASASTTREVTGMEESMPSPPPPYTPTQTNLMQQVASSPSIPHTLTLTTSPVADVSILNSPQTLLSPTFPPPPGQGSSSRDRSAPGLASARSFFGRAGLRGKQPVSNNEPQLNPYAQAEPAPQVFDARPPAARRAASTGQMYHSIVAPPSAGPSERSSPDNGWQPGMPLPPPPPGLPPPAMRSQSVDRFPSNASSKANSWTSEHDLEPVPKRIQNIRMAAAGKSMLSPVPPTPADWNDGDEDQPSGSILNAEHGATYPPLRINTGSRGEHSLTRKPAKRDNSQGIRERRSQSRRARDSRGDLVGGDVASSSSQSSRPSDIISGTPESGMISRRREHRRAGSGYVEPKSPPAVVNAAPQKAQSHEEVRPSANVMTPPYTPAVNSQSGDASRRHPGTNVPSSAGSDQTDSRPFHTPNEVTSAPTPLTPAMPHSATSNKASARLDPFALQALERHRTFVEKELAATSDGERLELFANFMVHESRLRRDRYHAAYNAMAGDLVELTRDMWRPYGRQSKRAITPSTSMSSFDPTAPSWASDGQPQSAEGGMPSSASSFGDFTPATEGGSVGDAADLLERHAPRPWKDEYKPSLSPIPSMAVSTVAEENSSRGRTQSRWWEQSNSGGGSIGRADRIEKTRRETKYMGVTAASLQEPELPSPAMSRNTPTPSAGENEFPPEKVGWHDGGEYETPLATPHKQRHVTTPGLDPLDVSRLVTLPPPYPRHYPAVNNKHPMLNELRSSHRSLADTSEIQRIKDAFLDQDFAMQRAGIEDAKKRRNASRATIQQQIADGSMSFADAAKAEADFDTEAAARGKANARANFDLFESNVTNPLNDLLTDRIKLANTCINDLRTEVESRDRTSDPNHAQEEGDEEPERLEKLTLLKWLFEARELLHKEMMDLHAQRSEKYSEVILTPYRIAKLQAKMDEASAFFAKDSRERQTTFAKDSLQRFEELQATMELNVSRGVEDQLSAFWDIAPGLLEVIQHVPASMAECEIQIPPDEYDENPAYRTHPLQYLYSLLSHAEKSAYQFIESQVSQLCLLHEVRTATMGARLRVLEGEGEVPGDGRLEEEERLTVDLKEKVGEVERQWREALGVAIGECKDRVNGWLEESGGWEEGLEG